MQLQNLVKPIEDCSDEELLERLRVIRNTRTVIRPAAKARVKRIEQKSLQTKVSKVENLIFGLSPEQLQQLLVKLENTNDQD